MGFPPTLYPAFFSPHGAGCRGVSETFLSTMLQINRKNKKRNVFRFEALKHNQHLQRPPAKEFKKKYERPYLEIFLTLFHLTLTFYVFSSFPTESSCLTTSLHRFFLSTRATFNLRVACSSRSKLLLVFSLSFNDRKRNIPFMI